MSSRSGSRSRRHRSREPRSHDVLSPVLPNVGGPLPSLLSLAQDGENIAPSARIPPPRSWSNAARRAERIRSIDEYSGFQRALDQSINHEHSLRTGPARLIYGLRPHALYDDVNRTPEIPTNSQLRDLLETTNQQTSMSFNLPPPGSASPLPRSLDLPEDNRRNKRRKIDADRLAPTIRPIRYGRYGQVEPGALRMEILSCDGGSYNSSSAFSYVPENLLKNDETVYCTKGNRCNIVFRHEGGAPFTLHELIIKGPTSANFSHPIREGMVFIAMRQDEVLNRTAQYQIQYSPLTQRDNSAAATEREGLLVGTTRYHHDGTSTTRMRRSQAHRGEDESYRMAQMPPEFSTSIPEFGVTTVCNDDDFDADGRHISHRAPNRIGSLPFESIDSDEENNNSTNSNNRRSNFDFDGFLASANQGNPVNALREARERREREQRELIERELAERVPRYSSRSETQNQNHNRNQNQSQSHDQSQSQSQSQNSNSDSFAMSFAEALEAHNNATQEAIRAVGGELLAPHARFHIDKRSSTCALRFDPPVSGRFILLKMWNSHNDPSSNIDIQIVMARGYAGGRFFPAVEYL